MAQTIELPSLVPAAALAAEYVNGNEFDMLSKCGMNLGKSLLWVGVDVALIKEGEQNYSLSHGIMRGFSRASHLHCQF